MHSVVGNFPYSWIVIGSFLLSKVYIKTRSVCLDIHLLNMFTKADTVRLSKIKPFFPGEVVLSGHRFYSGVGWFSVGFTDLKICYCSFNES